jgi:uncharacterized DUF497 family protein
MSSTSLDAALIFENAVFEAVDPREDYGEIRYRALGHSGDNYFMVAYAKRGENRGLISAWRVGENGKPRYQRVLARRD